MRLCILVGAIALISAPAMAWDQQPSNNTTSQANAKSHSSARAHSNASASATGGSGGSATAHGGSANAGFNGSIGSFSGGSPSYTAPSITVPEGLGNAPCGGGIGIGGIGLGGGGSGGGTLYEFGDCKRMREATMLITLGYPQEALNELCQIDRVRDAFGGKCPNGQVKYPYDYCRTRNAGDKNQHLECDQN